MESFDTAEERSAVSASVSTAPIIPELVIADGRVLNTPKMTTSRHGLTSSNASGGSTDDPATIITLLENDYPIIYLTDVNGLERNKPQLQVLQKATKSANANLWIGPGIRYADTIIDIIISGAGEVILSTSTLVSFHELIDALELSSNIIFNIDYDFERRRVLSADSYIQGYSLEKLIQQVFDLGIHTIIISVHPMMSDSTSTRPVNHGDYRRPSVFEHITSFIFSQPRYRSSRSYSRSDGEDQTREGSAGALQLFARGSYAWEHREWLLDNGWTGVIADILQIQPASLHAGPGG